VVDVENNVLLEVAVRILYVLVGNQTHLMVKMTVCVSAMVFVSILILIVLIVEVVVMFVKMENYVVIGTV